MLQTCISKKYCTKIPTTKGSSNERKGTADSGFLISRKTATFPIY